MGTQLVVYKPRRQRKRYAGEFAVFGVFVTIAITSLVLLSKLSGAAIHGNPLAFMDSVGPTPKFRGSTATSDPVELLFANSGKGPRADVVEARLRGLTRHAIAGEADPITTGSVPKPEVRINRSAKAARLTRREIEIARANTPFGTGVSLDTVFRMPASAELGLHFRQLNPPKKRVLHVALPKQEDLRGRTTRTKSVAAAKKFYKYRLPKNRTKLAREQRCLAVAIYFEARSEPVRGQVAVAQVVMNRVNSGIYPNSICRVVFQNQTWRNRCQFSFACDGRSDKPRHAKSWKRAMQLARQVTEGGRWLKDIGHGATHYHADLCASALVQEPA